VAGRSGCGKTTLGRVLTGHLAPSAGRVLLGDEELYRGPAAARRGRRRRTQMLFQDPGSSLDPRQRIGAAVREAAGAAGAAADPAAALAEVGLDPDLADRFPHQLSGGQRQRAALARCLAARPSVLVADEPTSALDRAARDRILDLLDSARRSRGLGLVIVSHDLAVLVRACGRIAVMLDGLVVEDFRPAHDAPAHPYTRRLWSASPAFGDGSGVGETAPTDGAAAAPGRAPEGCPFAMECGLWKPSCSKELPPLVEVAPGHLVRCPEVEHRPSAQFIDTY